MATPNRLSTRGSERACSFSKLLYPSVLPIVLLLAARPAHAQLPEDNAVYKQRCQLLASQDGALQTGTVPSVIATTTHGIPALQFETFAFDRSKNGDHQVACTLFYLAAASYRAGNGAAPDMKHAHTAAVLAEAEMRLAQRQKLTMSEHVSEAEAKAAQVKAPALTAPQLEAIIGAISTMPVSLAPPPQLPAYNPKPAAHR